MSERSNPFEELERLFERMSEQFEETSRTLEPGRSLERWTGTGESMAIDIVEHPDEFLATVDLPGFERSDVEVSVTDHMLRIAADREKEVEAEAEEYLRHERRHESLHRSIRLPDDVDKENVTATMKNGVLTITLPKLEAEEAREIEIGGE